jgi:preprotein translocase subunit SecE
MAKTAALQVPSEGGIVGQVKSWPQRVKSFYNDVRTEMKKVTTPSRKEVQSTTVVVVIAVFLFALYFFVVDKIIQTGVNTLIHHFVK